MSQIDLPEIANLPVLVVDDEEALLQTVRLGYGDEFRILTATSGAEALSLLADHDVAVIVADQRMPQMTGTELLARARAIRPDAEQIVLTGYTDMGSLVEAVNRSQIYGYLNKPWEHEELRGMLRRALERFILSRENRRLLSELQRANERLRLQNDYLKQVAAPVPRLVGDSPAVKRVLDLVRSVAPTRSTVLVSGETGTGKEVVARIIHAHSDRTKGLFVAVNCGALVDTLAESELFGHRRGAFTDAIGDRKGLVEYADGGTLFLDEVGELSPAVQSKLLRILQEEEVHPVGENRPRKVDVRVIAATNRDLGRAVADGSFRADLLYRLEVFPISLPPLRERPDDIAPIARAFLPKLVQKRGIPACEISEDALLCLSTYSFPGNVRELENELERAAILARATGVILPEHLSERICRDSGDLPPPGSSFYDQLEALERRLVCDALERNAGSKSKTAAELDVSVRGLAKMLARLKIK